jgi:hypothetical protein
MKLITDFGLVPSEDDPNELVLVVRTSEDIVPKPKGSTLHDKRVASKPDLFRRIRNP